MTKGKEEKMKKKPGLSKGLGSAQTGCGGNLPQGQGLGSGGEAASFWET